MKSENLIYKELESGNKKVQIFRQKSPINQGYEYFIQVLTLGMFDTWNVNESYKQKTSINSDKVAVRIANEFLNDGL